MMSDTSDESDSDFFYSRKEPLENQQRKMDLLSSLMKRKARKKELTLLRHPNLKPKVSKIMT